MDQDLLDFVATIRMVARDEIGGTLAAIWGYVVNFDPATYTVQVALPTYQLNGQNIVSPSMPLGSPYVGNGYGLECYPEQDTPCVVLIIDDESGASVTAVLIHNLAVPPVGGLQPGEFQIISKGGSKLKFQANGKLQVNGGLTPFAVEGSTVTHHHGLAAFFTALATEITTYTMAHPASGAMMGTSDLAAIFSALALTLAGPPVLGTDAAGGGLSPTPASVDSGQGAQDVIGPSPGGT